MNKKLICLLAFVFSLSLGFTACSDDDDDPVIVNLELEKTAVDVEKGKTVDVKITKGNGDYKAEPADKTIATTTIKDGVITITGVAKGSTTVAVTDKEGKKASITVTVKDETPAPNPDYADEIKGTYEGDLTLMGEATEQSIIVDRTAENVTKISLNDFMFAGENVGDIVVEDIAVSKDAETYSLAETTQDVTVTIAGAEVPAKATVSGTVKDGELNLTILVTEIPEVADLTVTFKGTIPAEEEGE